MNETWTPPHAKRYTPLTKEEATTKRAQLLELMAELAYDQAYELNIDTDPDEDCDDNGLPAHEDALQTMGELWHELSDGNAENYEECAAIADKFGRTKWR